MKKFLIGLISALTITATCISANALTLESAESSTNEGETIAVVAGTSTAIDGVSVMSGKSGTVGTFKFTKTVDHAQTVVNTGVTEAVVTFNSSTNTYSVTAAGYAGIITFDIVYTDGSTDTAEVKLFSGEKWKPGLNMITGTSEIYGFENEDENAVAVTLNNVNIQSDPESTYGNVAVYGSGAGYISMTVKREPAIEKERGLYVHLNYKGSWGNGYFLLANGWSSHASISAQNTQTSWQWSYKYYDEGSIASLDNLRLLINNTASNNNNPICIDNISLVPAYKFTYIDFDGEETVEYAIVDEFDNIITSWTPNFPSGAKKYTVNGGEEVYEGAYFLANEDVVFTAVIDSSIIGDTFMSGVTGTTKSFQFGKNIDDEKSAVETGVTEANVVFDEVNNAYTVTAAGYSGVITFDVVYTDGTSYTAEVSLLGGEKWKPGLNIITGTTEEYGFENTDENAIAVTLNNMYVQLDPAGSITNGNIAVLFSGSGYIAPAVKRDVAIEKERGMLVELDYKGSWGNSGYILLGNGWSSHAAISATSGKTSWTKSSKYYNNGSVAALDSIRILINNVSNNVQSPVCIDNVSFVPAYKFTYVDVYGEPVTEYKITDENGDIITEWTPVFESGATKYTVNGGEEVYEGAYTLTNEDVVFTAVETVIEGPLYEGTTLMSGASGTAGTIIFKKAVNVEKTTVDTGTSEAKVSFNASANTYTITATGYAGVVTISIVYKDETTDTVEVKLLGGEKWKPGLNMITGTTESYGFENAEENAIAVDLNNATIQPDPAEESTNGNVVVYGSGAGYIAMRQKRNVAIENERGLLVKLNYKGSWGNSGYFLLANGWSSHIAINANNHQKSWRSSSSYYNNGSITAIDNIRILINNVANSETNPVCVDNLALVPSYKFTYVDLDGSETVVYKITDASGNIITTHTPEFASGATKYTVDAVEYEGAYTLANKDVVFTAVAPELGIDETVTSRIDKNGDKVTGGIRFKASIANADKEKEAVSEYGFIVAREKHLTAKNAELTHEFKLDGTTPLYVTGVSFNRAEGIDKVFDKDGTNCYFTGVCVNIPTETAATVKENLVARPYMAVKIGEKTVYVYGKTNKYSLGQAMLDVQTEGGTDYTNNQVYVDSIVDLYNTAE